MVSKAKICEHISFFLFLRLCVCVFVRFGHLLPHSENSFVENYSVLFRLTNNLSEARTKVN